MANIPAATPLQNAQFNAVLPAGAGPIEANQTPTAGDVLMERERLRGIKRLREVGGNDWVTDEEVANGISRKHSIISKFSGQEAAPAWANAIFVQIRDIGVRMERVEYRMNRIDARMDAGHARVHNDSISRFDNSILRPVVKYTPGHPGPPPRREFQFNEHQYAVGTSPPDNLVPNTLRGIREIDSIARFRAIYWFYNDTRLAVGDQSMTDLRSALEEFMKSF